MSKVITVTDKGLKELNDKLDYLKNVKRKEVVEAIRVALGYGDLSENSEYDEAKNEQAKTEAQIAELEETLKHVKVIHEDEMTSDAVSVGTVVKVLDVEFDEEVEYTILGSTESDPLNNKISDQSPIGKALIGAKVGDEVTANAPGGDLVFRVLSIARQND